jgi:hypothetical protein
MQKTVQFYVENTGYDDTKLRDFAAESWVKYGWDVEIRNPLHAQQHPRYFYVHSNMRALTRGYGTGARAEVMYNRWLGYRPGWTSDYDIINVGFTPADAAAVLAVHEDPEKLFVIAKPVTAGGRTMLPPTPTFITEQSIAKLIAKLETFEDDGKLPYVDDQNLIGTLWREELVEHVPVCAMCGCAGWEHAPLIHFSAWSLDRSQWGRDRIIAVKKALKQRKAL